MCALFRISNVTKTKLAGESNNCADSNLKCNCDAKQPTWLTDDGVITSMELLPITAFQYGPLEFDLERANVTLGRLICSGNFLTNILGFFFKYLGTFRF